MIDNSSAKTFTSVNSDSGFDSRIDQFRNRLNNLLVKDPNGLILGTVKDVFLAPNGQINLVVSQTTSGQNSRQFLLSSNLIQKIDYATKSLLINVTADRLEQLRETSPVPLTENSDLSENKPEHDEIEAHESIRLLEERLVINRKKQKVGDVIVRKEIETRMVQVPVRREKLIVEQISPERKQLAEIDLGEGEITGLEFSDITRLESGPVVRGEFVSPQVAARILKAISAQPRHGCAKVRIELVLHDSEVRETYQEWFDRYSETR
ncbi:YsnF/AvaK domain-containing protein [Ancylothrix sp. C2]|uniref:YsnF/AvaK domain-containing protein n=1 Tax=Ancylothrix sp. D3o TaxID=2953691 RepID=UPI0021BAB26F|nr:YsnF/AvaK domain-containing protein [Ancylothrix sp. D3o]MCT7951118.1 YsnF/AvaK domain-containing protein [Ancylothrix sp. D3o]